MFITLSCNNIFKYTTQTFLLHFVHVSCRKDVEFAEPYVLKVVMKSQ